ncbi:inner membrane protein YqjA [archaeon]|nr:inner membrane protein YqjA [archaeon]
MLIENIASSIVGIIGSLGYGGVLVLMFLESTFFPFPSEIVIIPAGYLASRGELNLYLVIFFGIAGSLLGSLFNYYIAKTLGRTTILRYGKYFFLNEDKLVKVERFFKEHGEISTFIGRLIPGVRQYISFPAGLGKMNMAKFCFYTSFGAGLWVTILAFIGYLVGTSPELVRQYSSLATKLMLLFSALLIILYIYYKKRKAYKQT